MREWGAEAVTSLVRSALTHDHDPPLKQDLVSHVIYDVADWQGWLTNIIKATQTLNNRPYSRYPPSLRALKDWWNKSNVTWFLLWQTDLIIKSVNTRNRGQVYLFLTTENEELLNSKTIMANDLGRSDHCYFLDAVTTVLVLTATNNYLKSWPNFICRFAWLKSLSYFRE